ncbi:hypothetical protein L218DRAFT_47502 [Marasmius fiardii PR-910]|nr:hypothetical protein L218DRAFT_47502 [Marasmius fiardii PR-910]
MTFHHSIRVTCQESSIPSIVWYKPLASLLERLDLVTRKELANILRLYYTAAELFHLLNDGVCGISFSVKSSQQNFVATSCPTLSIPKIISRSQSSYGSCCRFLGWEEPICMNITSTSPMSPSCLTGNPAYYNHCMSEPGAIDVHRTGRMPLRYVQRSTGNSLNNVGRQCLQRHEVHAIGFMSMCKIFLPSTVLDHLNVEAQCKYSLLVFDAMEPVYLHTWN